MLKLATDRLYMRPPLMDDAAAIAAALSNFEVSKNLAFVPHPYDISDAVAWLERQPALAHPFDQKFAIFTHEDQFCGMTGFTNKNDLPSLGYYLHPDAWGKGYMTEANWALIKWLFDGPGAPKIISGVFDYNQASMRVQKKLGFQTVSQSVMHSLAQSKDFAHIDTELTQSAFENAAPTLSELRKDT
ncbi:GNAT family N-acetyltransferase [Maritalea mediterranea]|uniref:GNAT family N-acetyltransferase n=1 Tax=Maritalea mediterranea TaxID=2909667 RepID=A0ABS9E3V4_9HYPH|nr:GNAT family N-acetyltransferase [Maritalea mediterranea]MCF4097541.1 GNAT family N-acetyltransferase [Maritalea mediterranea]